MKIDGLESDTDAKAKAYHVERHSYPNRLPTPILGTEMKRSEGGGGEDGGDAPRKKRSNEGRYLVTQYSMRADTALKST